MFVTAIALCSFLCLAAESASSPQADHYGYSSEFNATSYDSTEADAVVVLPSVASHFEHSQQAAVWVFAGISSEPFARLVADAYLMTEPIEEPWFWVFAVLASRLCGWKDSNLQYKVKNAFI